MTKSELFKFAHTIAKGKSIAFYGSYANAFGAVLRELYAKGYAGGGNAFQVVEPSYKRNMYSRGQWVAL